MLEIRTLQASPDYSHLGVRETLGVLETVAFFAPNMGFSLDLMCVNYTYYPNTCPPMSLSAESAKCTLEPDGYIKSEQF